MQTILRSMQTIKQDAIAGLVVLLIAIPLCLGIALASNAPLSSGILAGVIGGIIVGLLSQSQVSVSGPAAGLIAVVLACQQSLGSYPAFLCALTLAGLMQVAIGKLRAGFIADYVPSNVIQGLLCAIGLTIILKQVPFALGFYSQKHLILQDIALFKAHFSLAPLAHISHLLAPGAVIISLVSLLILFQWKTLVPARLQSIPAPIVVVVLAVIANQLFASFAPSLALAGTEYLVNIPTVASMSSFKQLFIHPDFAVLTNFKVYFYAALIAVVACIETLLNLEAAEKIDPQKRYCSRDKELVAQGIGNTLAGLLGGLPITSVVVRSSVNVQAGSQSKLSTIIHGILLLSSVLFLSMWINAIPLSVLAAVLIHVGYKLAHHHVFKAMYQKGWANFLPFIVTVVMIISTDLLIGILCGLLVSILWIMKQNSKPLFEQQIEAYPGEEVLRLKLPEQATFLNKAALIQSLRALPNNAQVILDGSETRHIDHDILEVIQDFSRNLSREKNIALRTEGFSQHSLVDDREDFINITTAKLQFSLNALDVLNVLKQGNQRFVHNKPLPRCLPTQVANTAASQHPLAVVLGCMDSRVPVERVFDVGVGDIFVTRVAGNVISPDILASIEFGCAVAGAKLIVIMGHTCCGAIESACEHQEKGTGHLPQLLKKIQPAIEKVNADGISTIDKDSFYQRVTRANIHLAKQALCKQSELLKTMLDEKRIGLIGALYDVKTGHVVFDDSNACQAITASAHESQLSA